MNPPAKNSNIKDSKVQDKLVPFFWIRDASGHRSVSVTLLVVSFFVTTVAFILSIFKQIGPLEIRSFDVAACSTYMVPILTLYFSRRWTDARHGITQLRESAQFASVPLNQPMPGDPNFMGPYQYPPYPQSYGNWPSTTGYVQVQPPFVPPADGQ